MKFLTGINGLQWKQLLQNLPTALQNTQVIDGDCIQIGDPTILPKQEISKIKAVLEGLRPWRKGPFSLYGIHIDSEWRSDLKWQRLAPWVTPHLNNKDILDIGCGNGYHMMRLLPHAPKSILGIDPSLRFYSQFKALQHFLQNPILEFNPIGIDDLSGLQRQWDTIFCMGVLYHRRDPLNCLNQILCALRKNGSLILETLILTGEGDDCLVPESRYAQMRNIYQIPTISRLKTWLEQAGFKNIEVKSIDRTTVQEQRSTEWGAPVSLKDFLNPQDPMLTIEGYPAPTRAIIHCIIGP